MRVLASERADVRAPAQLVFDYICDLTRWPTWFTCVVCAEQAEQQPLGLGEEIHVCMNAGRRRWQEEMEVTRFIRNAFLSFEALYSTARRIDFRVERRGQLTRVACSVGYPVYGGMLPAIFHSLVSRRRLARGLRDSLEHLKNLLEEKSGAAATDEAVELESAVLGPPRAATAPTLRVV